MKKIIRLTLGAALVAASLAAKADFAFGIPEFNVNSAILDEQSKYILSDAATWLKRLPNNQLIIYGSRGQLESDFSVSLARLQSAKQYLIEIGVNEDRVILKDVGTSQLLRSDCMNYELPDECDKYNRNIQLQLVAP